MFSKTAHFDFGKGAASAAPYPVQKNSRGFSPENQPRRSAPRKTRNAPKIFARNPELGIRPHRVAV
jgi:hypothetical protein